MLCTKKLTPPPPAAPSVKETEIEAEEDGVMCDPLIHPRRSPVSSSTELAENGSDVTTQHRIFGGLVSFVQVKGGLLGKPQCMPHRILQERVIPMKGPGLRVMSLFPEE